MHALISVALVYIAISSIVLLLAHHQLGLVVNILRSLPDISWVCVVIEIGLF